MLNRHLLVLSPDLFAIETIVLLPAILNPMAYIKTIKTFIILF
jgi:hypothetical protein